MFADVADKPPTGALAFRFGHDTGFGRCGDVRRGAGRV